MNSASERMLKYFYNENLPGHLREVSKPIYDLALQLATDFDSNNPVAGAEVTTGLRKLREAKDCFVIAKLELENSK